MAILIISLILSGGVLALASGGMRQQRTLSRMFLVIMAGVWLYITLMLIIFSLTTRLEILLCVGLLPVVVVAYGFRYYEKRIRPVQEANEQEKVKWRE